jgi:ABC-type transport system substrate-binding protein
MDGALGPGGLLQTNNWFSKAAAAKYDDLAAQVQSTIDPAKRSTVVQAMLDEYENNAPETTLYIPKAIYAWKKTFDWTPYPLTYLDLRSYNFKVL